MTTNVRTIVREVLGQLSSSKEARLYLRQFSSVDALNFAVVKVGGGIIENQLEELAASLAFLWHLGLFPIVLHGAGSQLDQALEDAGVATHKLDGLRVTDEATMAVVRPVIYRTNRKLVEALERHGVRAQGIQHGVFSCDYHDQQRYGLVGKINAVELESIRDTINAGVLPVVTCLGESSAGQVLNINADIAARELVWAIKPHKVLFITPTGGLLDGNGELISAISLCEDYQQLMQQDWVHSGMRLKLEQIQQILEPLPPSASVSITSVDNMARELFTHEGAGTLIRQGERIYHLEDLAEEQHRLLIELLETSFARKLRPDYFSTLKLKTILFASSGRAAAIITEGIGGVAYLDKFAVTPQARGEGLGATLWQRLQTEYPALYWRSRRANPVNNWYFQQAGFTAKNDTWVGFAYGMSSVVSAANCLEDAFSREDGWLPLNNSEGLAT
ncbi:MAG: acetylglutamate kinase [Xanthomonadales bacterium]|nr:acetylglutamate kinase [Xanthomonadales bacterium]